MPLIPIILSFLKNNWKPIVLSIVIGFALYNAYQWAYNRGKMSADEIWTQEYNKLVEAHNKKVTDLEQRSVTDAESLKKDLAEAQLKLDQFQETKIETVKFVYRDRYNKPIQCKGQAPEEIYLGNEFQEIWNSINRLGEVNE